MIERKRRRGEANSRTVKEREKGKESNIWRWDSGGTPTITAEGEKHRTKGSGTWPSPFLMLSRRLEKSERAGRLKRVQLVSSFPMLSRRLEKGERSWGMERRRQAEQWKNEITVGIGLSRTDLRCALRRSFPSQRPWCGRPWWSGWRRPSRADRPRRAPTASANRPEVCDGVVRATNTNPVILVDFALRVDGIGNRRPTFAKSRKMEMRCVSENLCLIYWKIAVSIVQGFVL